jgi:hypothetical protein
MSELRPVSRADYGRLRWSIVVTGVFLLAVITLGAARPGYDAWHQSVSALSLGPGGWVQDVLFMVFGAALLLTVPVWRRVLAGGVGERAYPVLTMLTGLSLIAAAWWPQDPAPGYDPEQLGRVLPTTTGLIHLAAAGVGAGSATAALFVMAARFAKLPGWHEWVWPTRAAAFATIVCVVVYGAWSVEPSGFAGTFERLVVAIPGVWGYAVVRRLGRGVPFVVVTTNTVSSRA